MRRQLGDLSRKMNTVIRLVYTCRKIKDEIRTETSSGESTMCCLLVKCDLCDTEGYIEEHKGSVIGRHIKEQQGKCPEDNSKNFRILKKKPKQASLSWLSVTRSALKYLFRLFV